MRANARHLRYNSIHHRYNIFEYGGEIVRIRSTVVRSRPRLPCAVGWTRALCNPTCERNRGEGELVRISACRRATVAESGNGSTAFSTPTRLPCSSHGQLGRWVTSSRNHRQIWSRQARHTRPEQPIDDGKWH